MRKYVRVQILPGFKKSSWIEFIAEVIMLNGSSVIRKLRCFSMLQQFSFSFAQFQIPLFNIVFTKGDDIY